MRRSNPTIRRRQPLSLLARSPRICRTRATFKSRHPCLNIGLVREVERTFGGIVHDSVEVDVSDSCALADDPLATLHMIVEQFQRDTVFCTDIGFPLRRSQHASVTRPVRHLMAKGYPRTWRVAPSILPCQRHPTDATRHHGLGSAGRDQRRQANAARRCKFRGDPQ